MLLAVVLGSRNFLVRTYIVFLLGVKIVIAKVSTYLSMMNVVIVEVKTRSDITTKKLLTCCFSLATNVPSIAARQYWDVKFFSSTR
jgi:hypothetical protein